MPVVLQKWDLLITNTLNPLRIDLSSLSAEEVNEIVHLSAVESEEVPKLLIKGMINRPNIRDKHQFVQVHQAMLIRLLNKVFTYQQSQNIGDKAISLFQTISRHLEQVLNFIEDFFSSYFDRRERAPAPYFFVSTGTLCRQLVLLKEKLEESAYVNPELATILVNNFNRYCNGEKTSATYNDLHYQKDLLKELLSEKTPATETSIREVLFYFNFNDDDYVAYLYRRIASQIEEEPTRRERLAFLRMEQKIINQFRTKLNTGFNEAMPALKEQVAQWVGEEISFWEASSISEAVSKTEAEPEDKIITALSVARLALLLRLMVIDKIITNRVVAQMLRITVKMVSTEKVEAISFRSLETKYHNPDRGTISAVKDMLFRWINILNRL